MELDIKDRIKGCIYGSSIGDDMGLDTQQLLFTINGILYGETRLKIKGIGGDISKWIFLALKDWSKLNSDSGFITTWLYNSKDFKEGSNSTLEIVKSMDINSVGKSSNDTEECDVLSRAIGISLCYFNSKSREEIFDLSMKVCSITHGNNLITLSSGFLSSFVSLLINGINLDDAFNISLDILKGYPNSEVLVKRLEERNGDDCLSLCLSYCFKYVNDFENGVIESKKSNTTVSMLVGSILGLYNGIKEVDSIEILDTISNDINTFSMDEDYLNSEGWKERYVDVVYKYLVERANK
ncbi:MAG: ADP-ribosylglycohydrolase family protein [Candidatus Dojkabacteria bacterium]|jgi:ADP-ribosylglycohydrolase|nr:ADP-ribosylglycohydrolase family protein [Candidatus Dojkabacteria bacterium]